MKNAAGDVSLKCAEHNQPLYMSINRPFLKPILLLHNHLYTKSLIAYNLTA